MVSDMTKIGAVCLAIGAAEDLNQAMINLLPLVTKRYNQEALQGRFNHSEKEELRITDYVIGSSSSDDILLLPTPMGPIKIERDINRKTRKARYRVTTYDNDLIDLVCNVLGTEERSRFAIKTSADLRLVYGAAFATAPLDTECDDPAMAALKKAASAMATAANPALNPAAKAGKIINSSLSGRHAPSSNNAKFDRAMAKFKRTAGGYRNT